VTYGKLTPHKATMIIDKVRKESGR